MQHEGTGPERPVNMAEVMYFGADVLDCVEQLGVNLVSDRDYRAR